MENTKTYTKEEIEEIIRKAFNNEYSSGQANYWNSDYTSSYEDYQEEINAETYIERWNKENTTN